MSKPMRAVPRSPHPLCRALRILPHPPRLLSRAFYMLPCPRTRCVERCVCCTTPRAPCAKRCKCCPVPRTRCFGRREPPCAHSIERHEYLPSPAPFGAFSPVIFVSVLLALVVHGTQPLMDPAPSASSTIGFNSSYHPFMGPVTSVLP